MGEQIKIQPFRGGTPTDLIVRCPRPPRQDALPRPLCRNRSANRSAEPGRPTASTRASSASTAGGDLPSHLNAQTVCAGRARLDHRDVRVQPTAGDRRRGHHRTATGEYDNRTRRRPCRNAYVGTTTLGTTHWLRHDKAKHPTGNDIFEPGRRMSRAQVEHPPNWARMTPETFREGMCFRDSHCQALRVLTGSCPVSLAGQLVERPAAEEVADRDVQVEFLLEPGPQLRGEQRVNPGERQRDSRIDHVR
jgi:hypothetical protein